MKRYLLWMAVFCTVVFVAAACTGTATTQSQSSDHTHPAVPPEYAGKSNPMAGNAAALEDGSKLYASNCAACHGPEGLGDGPSAAALNPPPRPLAAEMDQTPDDYLYWRIAEGGQMAPFHSVMPAWKSVFSEEQIWQIITFLRSLS